MANYNTFLVVDCRTRKPVLVTSSARKANAWLRTGFRIEVWNENTIVEKIRQADRRKEAEPMQPYIDAEREYIRAKQAKAERRNRANEKKAEWWGRK